MKQNENKSRSVRGVELYELPDGWKWTRLGDVCEIVMGQSPSGDSMSENPNDTAFIGGASDMGTELPKITRYTNSPTKISKKDDVIVCIRATLGRPIFSDGVYCLGRGVAGVRSNTLSKEYIKYGFLNFEQYLYDNATGSTFLQVSSDSLKKMPFPLPPLPEQQRIVSRIESMFAKLDEATEKAESALESFETRKAAILHKAFTGELTAKWRKENGVSEDSWEEKTLGDMLLPMTSKTPTGETFRYIDIDAIDNVNQIVENPKLMEVSKAPSRASRGLIENDVLFSMVRPYLKNIAVIDASLSDCIASTGFYVCRCKPELNHLFLYNLLCSKDAIDYLMQFMKGDNSPSIRKDDLLKMLVNLPTLDEQKEIVRILNAVLEKERIAKEGSETVLSQIALLKKSILARAFRGEL
ncbi:MAG: restriction endonuclease subunit S [Treponema sp.]|nr:restriction endonuclease subunit S [Treponema sp.]